MRTPEQIVGRDRFIQLVFEGYKVVPTEGRKMRELSKMTPLELRDRDEIGVMRAKERISAAQLLDKCDEAKTFDDLKVVVSELITRVTGER